MSNNNVLPLFLDIDGVLNSVQSSFYNQRRIERNELRCDEDNGPLLHQHLCPISVSNLNCLLEEFPDIRIVISSTWRKYKSVEQLKVVLRKNGLLYVDKVIGKTPVLDGKERGYEIQEWLDKHPETTHFVILDDDSDMVHLKDHWIGTNPFIGFDYFAFDRTVDHLIKQGLKPKGLYGKVNL
jgi:hypothetical protein